MWPSFRADVSLFLLAIPAELDFALLVIFGIPLVFLNLIRL